MQTTASQSLPERSWMVQWKSERQGRKSHFTIFLFRKLLRLGKASNVSIVVRHCRAAAFVPRTSPFMLLRVTFSLFLPHRQLSRSTLLDDANCT